jgi:hypothetical protein
MDVVVRMPAYKPAAQAAFNRVRIYFGVTYLSEIVTTERSSKECLGRGTPAPVPLPMAIPTPPGFKVLPQLAKDFGQRLSARALQTCQRKDS